MKRVAAAALAFVALSACGSRAPAARPVEQFPTSTALTSGTASTRDTVSTTCNTTAEAASAAALAHFAKTASFPTTFAEMLDATPPELEAGSGVQHTATTLTHPNDWKMTMTGGGASQPTFVCTVLRPVPTIP